MSTIVITALKEKSFANHMKKRSLAFNVLFLTEDKINKKEVYLTHIVLVNMTISVSNGGQIVSVLQ